MATTSTAALWTTTFIPGTPRLAVDTQGAGPLLVFLHGIGGNRSNWHDQFAACAAHCTVVAWDARGYGQSDDYDGPLNPLDFSHDLRRVLDYYGARKAHLVGLSMGGMIAQDFYSLYPERVATLVLCDTSDGLNITMTAAQREEFIRLRIAPLLAGQTPRDMAPGVADTLIGRQSSRAAWQRLVESMAALHTESYIKTVRANTSRTAYPDARQIRVPTLLVFGEDDRLTPPAIGQAMQSKIAGAALVIIPTAGHLSNIEQPAVFNAALLDFVLKHQDLAQ
ncbi:MAG: alpha/beta fold hydrolase [Candidatus Tectomicrobia bacterium]|uniref:Alpha/beta fold hydrolase n=1 Tax=Tectimicrobiota bacterium TaxID=2528274 RepID=A0A937W6B3_UNCTE|nr:alpha/beta fold hydrolase [Candidatus Tectomicrobia bacterium]